MRRLKFAFWVVMGELHITVGLIVTRTAIPWSIWHRDQAAKCAVMALKHKRN